MSITNVGIVGYGNIGRGVELSLGNAPDMNLVAVFTRRAPETVKILSEGVPVLPFEEAINMKNEISTLILCGGSAKDIPIHSPLFAKDFNIVDSYDNHARIEEHLRKINEVIINTTAVVSAGWDPGLFSILRCIMNSVLPNSSSHTFWGRGVSQGHSEAIRQIDGVIDAIQYSVPKEAALELARAGEANSLSPRERHLRECYVVVKKGADKLSIERSIKTMPDYFADYDTTVTFISKEEFDKNHSKMPHAGVVIHSGDIAGTKHRMEFSLELESNANFTASVLVCYARAAARLASEGIYGAKTVFDIPLAYIYPKDKTSLIKTLM